MILWIADKAKREIEEIESRLRDHWIAAGRPGVMVSDPYGSEEDRFIVASIGRSPDILAYYTDCGNLLAIVKVPE